MWRQSISRDKIDKATGNVVFSTWGEIRLWLQCNRVFFDWDSASGMGPFSVNTDDARKIAAAFLQLADDLDRLMDERIPKEG